MQDQIKMDYPLMDEMKRTFADGCQQLEATTGDLKAIADRLEQGALLGTAGDAFREAINNTLIKHIGTLQQKFEELQADIQFAVDQMHQAEDKAKSSF